LEIPFVINKEKKCFSKRGPRVTVYLITFGSDKRLFLEVTATGINSGRGALPVAIVPPVPTERREEMMSTIAAQTPVCFADLKQPLNYTNNLHSVIAFIARRRDMSTY
jgi:hypothetical protein